MREPKLRDSRKMISSEPYSLNEIPDHIIAKIGGYIVYLMHIGRKDLTGSDWGDAFADAVDGVHLDSPIGIADVVLDRMAWSVKTVKNVNPHKSKTVRLISGRCSPDYSYGISDPHEDIQKTGRAVLGIWNERVNIAQETYSPVRTVILVRSDDLRSFCIFEEENHRYRTTDYVWEVNKNGNLIGKNRDTGEVAFTWQPHGSQFTIHTKVPTSAVRFTLDCPSCVLDKDKVLEELGYDDSWVRIIKP